MHGTQERSDCTPQWGEPKGQKQTWEKPCMAFSNHVSHGRKLGIVWRLWSAYGRRNLGSGGPGVLRPSHCISRRHKNWVWCKAAPVIWGLTGSIRARAYDALYLNQKCRFSSSVHKKDWETMTLMGWITFPGLRFSNPSLKALQLEILGEIAHCRSRTENILYFSYQGAEKPLESFRVVAKGLESKECKLERLLHWPKRGPYTLLLRMKTTVD